MSAPDWNADSYHRVSEPQFQWGLKVLESLTLEGDETVIDAGCGTGRLTAELAKRLPRGKIIALDVSESMLEKAKVHLEPFKDRVWCAQADLGALNLEPIADVVFSTATFHWVPDHGALFAGIYRALKPNGRLHAQCGGFGNLQGFLAKAHAVSSQPPYAEHLAGFEYPAHFATAEVSERLLLRAGFAERRAWLTPAPTPFLSRADFQAFIATVVLRHPLGALPDALRQPYLDAVTDACPEHSLDYVRLELRANKGAQSRFG